MAPETIFFSITQPTVLPRSLNMIKFLTACAHVEETAAQIYRTMQQAAVAENQADLKKLWEGMAADEEAHSQQLRLAARLSRERVFDLVEPSQENHPTVLLKRAELMLDYVRSKKLSELEMLHIADELERDFHKIHTTYTLLFQDPSMKKTFEALAKADETHVASLQDRIRRFPKGVATE
jgi:rubrerythrin